MSPPIRRKYCDSVAFATGCRKIKNCKRCNRKIRIPIGMWPCKVEEKMILKEVDGKTVEEIETKIIAKDGTVTRIPGQFQGYETSKEEPIGNALYDRHNEVACLMLDYVLQNSISNFKNKSTKVMITESKKMYGKPPGC
ncbi:hypothetical protein Tco_1518141 [Tanacetum coccineum]